ncbi:MAG: cobalamin biosynthesis protein CobQ [Pseudomonadota bacterium]
MNTPGHLLLGAVAFARPAMLDVTLAALSGAAFPDLSVVFLVLWSQYVSGHSQQYIFDTLYFSDSWQAVFAIDNSIPLWTGLFALAVRRQWRLIVAFAGAGLLHLFLDLLLHHDDGRVHFWPFTDWKFESPVSYWDSAHYGSIAAAALLALSAAATIALFQRFKGVGYRAIFTALLVAEAYFASVWIRFF